MSEDATRVVEVGELLAPSHSSLCRRDTLSDARFTLADSTGVGAQDLAIASLVYERLARTDETASASKL